MVVGLHDGQGTCAYERSTAGNTTTGGHVAIHQNLHTDRDQRASIRLAQELQCAKQTGLEVVHPFVLLRINLDIGIVGHAKFARGELLRRNVGNFNSRAGGPGGNDLDGHNHIDAHGGREDIVEGVVDMLADDVDASRASRHEVGSVIIFLVKLGDETFPALLVLWRN